MISRCANPGCHAHFDLRRGKLFRFPKQPKDRPANTHAVQHFWLCEICCKSYLLQYVEGQGVALESRLEKAPGEMRYFVGAA